MWLINVTNVGKHEFDKGGDDLEILIGEQSTLVLLKRNLWIVKTSFL